MRRPTGRGRRLSAVGCAVVAGALALAPGASARVKAGALEWQGCGDAAGVQCATADLPMDYGDRQGSRVHIALARVPAKDQANRIGSLVFNFGGPGGAAVDYLQATAGEGLFDTLNQRFDIVAFDPRGVGQSTPSIDCKANQETEGIYSVPFARPIGLDVQQLLAKTTGYISKCLANNGEILAHVSTANVARDMNRIRKLLGERRLNYLGFSYGTFVGATYASLFPKRYRAMVLDGPLDADQYINRPMQGLFEQTSGFEVAFGRFMQACAADQTACSGFGGSDPWAAYDQLVEQANKAPIPADAYEDDPRPVSGDDIITATLYDLYRKEYWGEIAQALSMAAKGDGSLIRALVDGYYDRQDDGTFGPGTDLYFTIGASEQRYERDVDLYLRRGDESWGTFPHFWSNAGYVELNYGLWPVHDEDAYYGPFRVPASSPTPLVVATTYDPATPYRGALRLVNQLGNARLLTMQGDGHTAYGGESACIDQAVDAYFDALALPAEGTVCQQEVPFSAPEPQVSAQAQSAAPRVRADARRRIARR
jgi:pimeloyl-ACP methyl ester carboxylesterase